MISALIVLKMSCDQAEGHKVTYNRTVIAIVAVITVVFALAVIGAHTGTDTGPSAAGACVDAYQAGSQFAAGQRSQGSTLSALLSDEDAERSAGDRYDGVVADIVTLEQDVRSNIARLGNLYADCGSQIPAP